MAPGQNPHSHPLLDLKKWTYELATNGHLFYLCGLVSVVALLPQLFHDGEYRHEFSGGTLEKAVRGDVFRIFVYCTIAVAFPLTLDLITDIFFAKGGSMLHLLPRILICSTLLGTSALHIWLSLRGDHTHDAWVIYNMEVVMTGAMTLHQVQDRYRHAGAFLPCYVAVLCWNGGIIVRVYGAGSAVTTVIGIGMRYTAILITFGVFCKHLHMVFTGQLTDWYNKWLKTVFDSFLMVALGISVGVAWLFKGDDDFDVSGSSFIVWSFDMVVFLVLMSTIITNEYRHDYAQAQQKLGVKQMFVRYVSHEVRTPLNSCKLGIEYMKTAILNPTAACIDEIAGVLDEVSEGCNTAIDFMNNLLLYEKIDSMEMPLYMKNEDLSAVCAEVLNSFLMSARQLEIRLTLDIHKSLTTDPTEKEVASGATSSHATVRAIVEIDAPKVVIVLRNLMSNALKFTPKDGKVTLSVLPVYITPVTGRTGINIKSVADEDPLALAPSSPENTTHFRVILSDNGRGMSREEQEQLFTKIVQFSPNENQKGGGSGIGLFLSHEIMTNHKLKIQVYSGGNKGHGTNFFVDFPAVQSQRKQSVLGDMEPIERDLSQDASTLSINALNVLRSSSREQGVSQSLSAAQITRIPSIDDGGGQEQKQINNLSILLVDDSSLNRKMLVRTLKQHKIGSTFEEIDDGRELLTLLGVPEDAELNFGRNFEAGSVGGGKVVPSGICTLLEKPNSYDVILLDDHMTHMDGSEAVKILRQFGYRGFIVGLTGSASDEDLNAFCEMGVDIALTKPFVVEDFVRILKAHFF